jgi:hypothetical protein
MTDPTAADAWHGDYAVLGMYVTQRLGVRPPTRAEQDAAIARASDTLDDDVSELAARCRRFLAIEYIAGTRGPARHKLMQGDFQLAIATVDSATDADIRRWARGGMVLRAAVGGWVKP